MTLPTGTAKLNEGCITSFSVIVNYALKQFQMDINITAIDADIGHFRKSSFTETDYAQQLRTLNVRCDSVCNKAIMKDLFGEDVNCSI